MTNLKRQKALYNYLLTKREYVNQKDIYCDCDFYPEIKAATDYKHFDFHNSAIRYQITDDIRAINSNPDFEKIIISNGNGIKIATEEDYDKMIKSLYRAVFAKLKRIREIEKKAKRNGQITIDKKEIISFLENDN